MTAPARPSLLYAARRANERALARAPGLSARAGCLERFAPPLHFRSPALLGRMRVTGRASQSLWVGFEDLPAETEASPSWKGWLSGSGPRVCEGPLCRLKEPGARPSDLAKYHCKKLHVLFNCGTGAPVTDSYRHAPSCPKFLFTKLIFLKMYNKLSITNLSLIDEIG